MEPLTHGLASLALARAGLNRTTRLATPMILIAGYAPDIDWLTFLGGPPMMFAYRRTMTHSLLGAALLVTLVAFVFWRLGRSHPTQPIRFWRALLVCGIAAGVHLLLDFVNRYGLQLLWPFRKTWFAGCSVETVDPWMLFLLLLGLLLPGLFRMISEEIGARAERRGAQRGAVIALTLIAAYAAGRTILHLRAEQMLKARMYHGASPVAVGAYPSAISPLAWRGVVETENTMEEVDIQLGPRGSFDPDRGTTTFKPDPSAALDAARQTQTVERFLRFARFPIAQVRRMRDGYRVEVFDLRFSADPTSWGGFAARVEMDEQIKVVREQILSVPRKRQQK